MSTVYVRWYGQVLQGEVVENKEEGLLSGMVAVRIQIQGMHATALFMPEHVYDSPEQIAENSSINSPKLAKTSQNQGILAKSDVLPANDRDMIEFFKRENWDHEHNHLRTDKLDEFYQLWRTVMRPARYVEAEASVNLPSHKEKPVSQALSKKVLRSAGEQKYNDSTQLSIFD